MKRYYPLSLDITKKRCIVIGAGKVGWQKIEKLLRYDPDIFVVAREILSSEIQEKISQKKITFLAKEWEADFLTKDTLLVFAATDDEELNTQIKNDAEECNILVNVADDRKKCRFIATAVIEDDNLQISIGTHGKNSLRARRTRQFLEKNWSLLESTPLRLGSRSSPLALCQVKEFTALLPEVHFCVSLFQNSGDRDKISPIEKVSFTDRLQKALLDKEIDVALHSAKDLDDVLPKGLEVFAFSDSVDASEALVAKEKGMTLATLPKGARIGVSGVRRREHLSAFRKDITLVPIRGNIEQRLQLIQTEHLDGIIIAMAALKRLGLSFLATEKIDPAILPAHPLQGKLAIQTRKNDAFVQGILREHLEQTALFSFSSSL